jgi:hypothetical protein
MDATITLKLTVQEFDLIRHAMADSADQYNSIFRDEKATPQVKRAAREKEAQLRLLLNKIQ